MSLLKKGSSLALVAALLTPATAPAGTAVTVSHDQIGCVLADQFPEITASFAPDAKSARVYFRSNLGQDFYYVEMTKGPLGWSGRLPQPRPEAGPITYWVEGTAADFSTGRTAENPAAVVKDQAECGGKKLAAVLPGGPVPVFSTTGASSLPAGFAGISGVAAGTGGGGAAAAAAGAGAAAGAAAAGGAAAAAGGAAIGTGVIVAGAVVAAGVATAVVVSNDDNASPSR